MYMYALSFTLSISMICSIRSFRNPIRYLDTFVKFNIVSECRLSTLPTLNIQNNQLFHLSHCGKSVKILHKYIVEYFTKFNISEPEESSRFLICEAAKLGYKLSDFSHNFDTNLSDLELNILENYCMKRLERYPVQYIIGNWDFYGHQFICQPPILIPRPETEELVEKIINSNILKTIENPRILDIGSGTGVIGITMLSKLSPDASCLGIDINPTAVDLSILNAKNILKNYQNYDCLLISIQDLVKSTIRTASSSTIKSLESPELLIENKYLNYFDIIISNPPYIPSNDIPLLDVEVSKYEDTLALDGGSDGMDIIKDIIRLAPKLLRKEGTREVWMEVHDGHPELIKQYLKSEHDLASTPVVIVGDEIHHPAKHSNSSNHNRCKFVEGLADLSGKSRFVRLQC